MKILMLPFFLIALNLFIDNIFIIDASSNIGNDGIEKLKKEIFRSAEEDLLENHSTMTNEDEKQKGKKSKKGKNKKKTVAKKSLPQEEANDENQKLTNFQSSEAKSQKTSNELEESSNKSSQSQHHNTKGTSSIKSKFEPSLFPEDIKRLRSIQKSSLIDNEEKEEAEKLALVMTNLLLFTPKSDQSDLRLYTGSFHYKILSLSILSQFDERNFDTEIFEKQFKQRKNEYLNLKSMIFKSAEKEEVIKENACRFYKFLIRLWRDEILAENDNWNEYFIFRMRHFYWIDREWENSSIQIVQKLKLNESGCTEDETKKFFSFYSTAPQSQQSMYWCLKWLLNNSSLFIQRIQKLKPENFLQFKQKIYDIIGFDGFYHLELAAPDVFKLENNLESFKVDCIKRILENENSNRNELLLAIKLLLQIVNSHRDEYQDNSEKFNEIIGRIREQLSRLTDVDRSQEEEEMVLNYVVCILLKFYEINQAKLEFTMIKAKNFNEKSNDDFMKCSPEEMDTSMERKRTILEAKYLEIIEDYIVNNEGIQDVLMFSVGSIYKLTEFIGGFAKLRKLWFKYLDLIRSEIYFNDDILESQSQLRIYYEGLITANSSSNRGVNKIFANIYAFAKWIESEVSKLYSFQILIENWRCEFRYWADQLYIHEEEARIIDKEVTMMSEKIVAFIKANKNCQKQNPKEFSENFRSELKADENFQNDLKAEKENKNLQIDTEEPILSEDLQKIHVDILKKIASKDKGKSKKNVVEFNFWQLFRDLHNQPELRDHIYKILDKGNLRILYKKLGLDFHEDKFPESSITGVFLNEEKTQSVDSLMKIIEGEKPKTMEEKGEDGIKKSTKKKLKNNNKMKMNNTPSTAADDKEKMVKKETENAKLIKVTRKEAEKEKEAIVEQVVKKVKETSPKTVEESGINKNKNEKQKAGKRKEEKKYKRRKNLQKFNKEFGKPKAKTEISLMRVRSAPRRSQVQSENSLMKNEHVETGRSQSSGKQRNGQAFGGHEIIKFNILTEYEFKDLMQFDTLDKHYKKLMKESDNQEQRRFMDILVFAFEIGQRLKGLEIYKKIFTDNEIHTNLMTYNESELEKIRKELDDIKINEFEDINELEKALYKMLIRIENGLKNNIKIEENKIVDKMEKIEEMRKQLHAFRFAWIIQRWKEIEDKEEEEEGKDKKRREELKRNNHILFALNLEAGRNFNEQLLIWKTILKQIKLDNDLYIERGIEEKREILGIKEKGIKIFDLAEYSQQLFFDDQNKYYEKNLTENLIKELEFVDIKDIEKGEPIKYEWMEKYMKTKERVTKIVREWHSNAQILFNGSYLLGTINSHSNLDIIVLTYNMKIDEKLTAECIIEEKGLDEQKNMQRERICKNDELFLCQLCKMNRVISSVKIQGYLELVKAFICEDDDYELKSFKECQYKIEVNFLFVDIPAANWNGKPDFVKDNLHILTSKEVKSVEINKILIELYALSERRKSFFSLLGFRDNIQMLELMPTDCRNFRIAGSALKLWAKRSNIYGPKLGFFKGVHINILITKIYLRYPTASVSFLIEQFFTTYIFWPWPMPVQLLPMSDLTKPRSEYGMWYDNDPNAVMPIISPGFIESNKASDIDNNTKIIMNTIMDDGLKQIREIRAGKMEAGKEWSDFLRGHDLGKKYQHYLVVNCLTKIKKGSFGDDFCAIASLKMHNFIPNVIGKILPQEIDWYHIIEGGSRKKCFINRDGYSEINNYKCDLWLVGLKPKKNEKIKWNEILKHEHLMNEASKKMYKDYFEFKQKKLKIQFGEKEKVVENLLLVTNYVAKKDLNKWNIQLRGWEVIVKDEEK